MIQSTTWDAEPHTEAKHEILKKYLQAWIPIISRFGKANYIDGFAGPGIYNNGKKGSPLIAIQSLLLSANLSAIILGTYQGKTTRTSPLLFTEIRIFLARQERVKCILI